MKVRQLVWADDNSCIPNTAISASSGFHRYTIVCVFVEMNKCVFRLKGMSQDDFPDEASAQKVAQAHFESTTRANME